MAISNGKLSNIAPSHSVAIDSIFAAWDLRPPSGRAAQCEAATKIPAIRIRLSAICHAHLRTNPVAKLRSPSASSLDPARVNVQPRAWRRGRGAVEPATTRSEFLIR